MDSQTLRWHRSLAARFGAVFVVFVVAGSLLLLAWLRRQQQLESERVFVTLAHADTDFVRRLNLPRSAKLAGDLRQLLAIQIYFRDAAGHLEPPPPEALYSQLAKAPASDDVHKLADQQQALVLHLDEHHDMIFVRETTTPTLSLFHPATRNALLTFWLLSAAFGWIVTRQVLRPIGALTRKLPNFFATRSGPPAETKRTDEIGRLARALTQARDDLLEERLKREQSERLALLGKVATGLAHEIKNPLSSIQLHTQLMDTSTLDAESIQSLQHVQTEVRVIEGLVNQWLFLARPVPPQKSPLDVLECLQQTLLAMGAQAAHAGVEMDFSPSISGAGSMPLPCIEGDRQRLQQAFRNILINGIQAMAHGGCMRVTWTIQDTNLHLTFHDEGRGFSDAALSQGTELFFSEKEGGMGVGLNVVREIIFAHRGHMTLKNHPKGGAEVELLLPLLESTIS
jgi:signal transduction histidine kinase